MSIVVWTKVKSWITSGRLRGWSAICAFCLSVALALMTSTIPVGAEAPPPLPPVPPPLPAPHQPQQPAAQHDQPPPLPPLGEGAQPLVRPPVPSIQRGPLSDEEVMARLSALTKRCPRGGQAAALMAGWQTSLVSGGRCYIVFPPEWRMYGNYYLTWIEGERSGVFIITQLLQGGYWSAEAENQMAVKMLQQRFPDLRVVTVRENPLPPEVRQFNARSISTTLRFTHNGVPAIGELTLSFIPCDPSLGICTMTAQGGWVEEGALDHEGCRVAMSLQSFKCPRGGCNEDQCDRDCRGRGAQGGFCHGSQCYCNGREW